MGYETAQMSQVPIKAHYQLRPSTIWQCADAVYALQKEICPITQEIRKETMQEKLEQHALWLKSGGIEGERLVLQGADLRDADLRVANLEGAKLNGANLRGANLRGANLNGANLWGANLRGAKLWGVKLNGANLEGAKLNGANLWDAKLWDANLRGATLRGANLRGANLRGANLEGAKLSEIPNPSPMVLLEALDQHTQSRNYDQGDWCGTTCCLAGCAGGLIKNQSLGVALIAQVLPEFNLRFLYQSNPAQAIDELQRVMAIYQARRLEEACKPKQVATVPVSVSC